MTSFCVPNQGRMRGAGAHQQLLELRAAVIDHLALASLADGVGQRCGTGDAQVLGRHGVSSTDGGRGLARSQRFTVPRW